MRSKERLELIELLEESLNRTRKEKEFRDRILELEEETLKDKDYIIELLKEKLEALDKK